jgi:hypothetical protein
MPLEFRGIALLDPPGRGIRFAGYPLKAKEGAIVICEVTVDALCVLSGLADPTPEELMGAFELHKEMIFEVASARFDNCAHRPRVTASDVSNLDEPVDNVRDVLSSDIPG